MILYLVTRGLGAAIFMAVVFSGVVLWSAYLLAMTAGALLMTMVLSLSVGVVRGWKSVPVYQPGHRRNRKVPPTHRA